MSTKPSPHMNRFLTVAVAALGLALVAYVLLFFIQSLLSDVWTIPLAVSIPVLGAISFGFAIKARANVIAMVALFVTLALLPATYVAIVLIWGP